MKITRLSLEGAMLIEPSVYADERGYFYESYNYIPFRDAGITEMFLQDNQSLSAKGVLRGLHFQNPPYAQGKLIRVIQGAVLDVIVDIRKNSPTYGQNLALRLDEQNKHMMWIPPGFAHGFLTLEENTIFLYKCTQVYHKKSEGGILWNDPELNIDWGLEHPVVSSKDLELGLFRYLNSEF